MQELIHRQNIVNKPRDEQRYDNTYHVESGDDKLSKYIQKLDTIKSSTISYFDSLRASINNTESMILNEISKQEATAISLHSERFMEDSLLSIERLLSQTTQSTQHLYASNVTSAHRLDPMHLRITRIDVINTKTLRIHFDIKNYNLKSQISLNKCHVLYHCQSQWFSAKIHSISWSNHHVTAFINHQNHNKDFYINVKIQFGADLFSNSYTVSIPKGDGQPIKNLFYLSQDLLKNPAGLYIFNKYRNASNACHVFELETQAPHVLTIRKQKKWKVKYAGVCFAKHIMLPPVVTHKLYTLYDTDSKTTDCLFKCGGMCSGTRGSTYCSCIILHNLDNSTFPSPCSRSHPCLSSKSDKCVGINWDLPSFPQQTDCNDITYSERNGLLSVGGWQFHYNSDAFYRLSFHSDSYFDVSDEWKWDKMPTMKTKRSWPSAVMLEKENQLMTIGGKGPIHSVEIFDFEAEKWTNASDIMYARSSAGVCYDVMNNKVYIGGGNGENINVSKTIECFDSHKNKWYQDIPETYTLHCSRPVMWLSDSEHLLYIASVVSDSMEYIDLRMNNAKGWNVVYGGGDKNNRRLWHSVFGTDFVKNDNCRLCL